MKNFHERPKKWNYDPVTLLLIMLVLVTFPVHGRRMVKKSAVIYVDEYECYDKERVVGHDLHSLHDTNSIFIPMNLTKKISIPLTKRSENRRLPSQSMKCLHLTDSSMYTLAKRNIMTLNLPLKLSSANSLRTSLELEADSISLPGEEPAHSRRNMSRNTIFSSLKDRIILPLIVGGTVVLALFGGYNAFVGTSSLVPHKTSLCVKFLNGGVLTALSYRDLQLPSWVPMAIVSLQKYVFSKAFCQFLFSEFLPSAVKTLRKMVLMEFWRQVWTYVWNQLKLNLRTSIQISKISEWTPTWISELASFLKGITVRGSKKMFQKGVQQRVEQVVSNMYSSFLSNGS